MTRYKQIFLCIVVLILATVAVSGLRGQNNDGKSKDANAARKEEPTPIQLGVMSEKQRKHSKLFKGTHYINRPKISDLVRKQGDVELWGAIKEVPLYDMPLGESLTNLKCNTDAIIIGSVKSKSSNLIETGTFIFTDYEITVEEVLKSSDQSPIRPGQEITVPRLGGAILLNGHTVRAIDEHIASLEKGERYLLYLKYEPLADTYRPLGHPMFDDSFQIKDDKILQVSRKPLPLGWKRRAEVNAFMSDVRHALANSCNNSGGE